MCTQGTACTKGGVSSDGQLVIFERNSTFKLVIFLTTLSFSAKIRIIERICRNMRKCLNVTYQDVQTRLALQGKTSWKDINNSLNISSIYSKQWILSIPLNKIEATDEK